MSQEGGGGNGVSQENLLKFIDDKIKQLETELEKYRALRQLMVKEVQEQDTPKTLPNLDELPWRQYQSGNGEWIYQDEAPEELVSELLRAGKPVKIGNHKYVLKSGSKGKSFVSRRPVK
jgi:hypothetical protein